MIPHLEMELLMGVFSATAGMTRSFPFFSVAAVVKSFSAPSPWLCRLFLYPPCFFFCQTPSISTPTMGWASHNLPSFSVVPPGGCGFVPPSSSPFWSGTDPAFLFQVSLLSTVGSLNLISKRGHFDRGKILTKRRFNKLGYYKIALFI